MVYCNDNTLHNSDKMLTVLLILHSKSLILSLKVPQLYSYVQLHTYMNIHVTIKFGVSQYTVTMDNRLIIEAAQSLVTIVATIYYSMIEVANNIAIYI